MSTKVPAELAQEIATTANGRDITRAYVRDLEEPKDPRLLGSVDWGVYDRIRMDDQVKSTMAQRISAVVSRDWDVLPGDDKDPRSVRAADEFKLMLEEASIDRVQEKTLWATFYGYSVTELIWKPGPNRIDFGLKVRHARRFRFTPAGELRLLTTSAPRGEAVPDRKFWVVRAGATDDDEFYGRGLAEWLYWPVTFKRNGIRFWNKFLDKFSVPPAVGKYRPGSPREEIAKLLAALGALANDTGIVIPEGAAIELLQAANAGPDFKTMPAYMDEAIAKIVLSQIMTTQDGGGGRATGKIHEGVKLEVIKADADTQSDSFNEGPARWWTDLNFGPDVASPRFVRIVEEEADLKAQAETDSTLDALGWTRNDDSFRDTYGDGYERKPEPKPATARPGALSPAANDTSVPGDPAAAPDARRPPTPRQQAASFALNEPQPLYVQRRLKNASKLVAWAMAQGFKSTLAASDMHVTVLFSRRPVDWFKLADDWQSEEPLVIPAGGPRRVVRIGDQGAIALLFGSSRLTWRHNDMVEQGASHDFPEYHPHVTITYDAGDIDLSKVEPYTGPLTFGPEEFEPLQLDWQDKISEASFAEPQGDIVDAIAAQLVEQGLTPMSPLIVPIVQAIAASNSVEELELNLLKSLDQAQVDQLVEQIGRAGFALRLAAEADADRLDG
jgi:phage gp29-like protein